MFDRVHSTSIEGVDAVPRFLAVEATGHRNAVHRSDRNFPTSKNLGEQRCTTMLAPGFDGGVLALRTPSDSVGKIRVR